MKQQSSVISPASDCADGADNLTAMELLPDLKSKSIVILVGKAKQKPLARPFWPKRKQKRS